MPVSECACAIWCASTSIVRMYVCMHDAPCGVSLLCVCARILFNVFASRALCNFGKRMCVFIARDFTFSRACAFTQKHVCVLVRTSFRTSPERVALHERIHTYKCVALYEHIHCHRKPTIIALLKCNVIITNKQEWHCSSAQCHYTNKQNESYCECGCESSRFCRRPES